MIPPQVKICGIRDPADGVAAVDAGATYIGVVFAERVRRVNAAEAAGVVGAILGRAVGVGVFVDAAEDEVVDCRNVAGFGVAQLHGSESPDVCARLRERGLRVWKAIRPRTPAELSVALEQYGPVVDAILVEGYSAAAAGGTGTTFPYEWLKDVERPAGLELVLAGGLSPETVGVAIAEVAPDVVDVSSGVESAPGVKSVRRIQEFMDAVSATDPDPKEVAGR